jgi:hypothetical protein
MVSLHIHTVIAYHPLLLIFYCRIYFLHLCTYCCFVFRFLKILQVIVLEPNASFKAFLPSILDLCLNQVYPILAEVFIYAFGIMSMQYAT